MMQTTYAPIVIFVYNRRAEIETLIDSLKNNKLASESEVFIFSDGPKNEQDELKVRSVREYIDGIKDRNLFKSVYITKAEKNKGLAKSVISGVTEVINKYGKVIVLEDDLTVSDIFLSYMNRCLDYYDKDQRIWAISGYTRNIKALEKYDRNVYLCYRAFSNGWATWKDRWDLADWKVQDYRKFLIDPIANVRLCRGGNDLPGMLKAQMRGKIDSWAVRWCYSQSKNERFSICPKKTMVKIGGFVNGTHTTLSDKDKFKSTELAVEEVDWLYDNLEVDDRISREVRSEFHVRLKRRIGTEFWYWYNRCFRR